MKDRIARVEDKVDKLASLLSEVVRDLKEMKGEKAEEPAPGAVPCKPEDYYNAYCLLFDEWSRGNKRLVNQRLKEMTLEDLQSLVEAAKLPIEDRSDRDKIIAELKVIFDGLKKKAKAEQFSGLYCLLSQEWSACNYPFVEGRLNEMSLQQLRTFAEANCIPVGKNSRRAGITKAIQKILEAKRTPVTEDVTKPRKYREPQEEHYTYMHSVLFDEWNQGNKDYVDRQLDSLDPERMAAFIKANKLPVQETADKSRIMAELREIYDRLKVSAKAEQYTGLYCLLSQEWNCGNRPFVERRLNELDQEALRAFAAANSIKVAEKATKPAIARAVKDHLKAAAAPAAAAS